MSLGTGLQSHEGSAASDVVAFVFAKTWLLDADRQGSLLKIKGVFVKVLSHVVLVFELVGKDIVFLSLWKRVFELSHVFVEVLADNNLTLLVLGIALVFVVLTKVAVLADALGIEHAVRVWALSGQLGSAL